VEGHDKEILAALPAVCHHFQIRSSTTGPILWTPEYWAWPYIMRHKYKKVKGNAEMACMMCIFFTESLSYCNWQIISIKGTGSYPPTMQSVI